MPNTQIFSGLSFSSTPYDSIEISGMGNTAAITFRTRSSHQETSATIEVCTLGQLSSMPAWREPPVEEYVEELINTWHTRKTAGAIIKYATKNESAFVFTAPENVDDCFVKWGGSGAPALDYFKEARFVALLHQYQITVAQLKAVPGMDARKIQLLALHPDIFTQMMKNGITIEQIGLLPHSVLEKW